METEQAIKAPPAIQMASCGKCRVLVPATPNDKIVLLCALHRDAEATARELRVLRPAHKIALRERDNLAAALEDARNLIKDYQDAFSEHLDRTEAIHAAAKGGGG